MPRLEAVRRDDVREPALDGGAEGDGFVYRLVVDHEPRRGLGGVVDRVLLARGNRRAFAQTFDALERELRS